MLRILNPIEHDEKLTFQHFVFAFDFREQSKKFWKNLDLLIHRKMNSQFLVLFPCILSNLSTRYNGCHAQLQVGPIVLHRRPFVK